MTKYTETVDICGKQGDSLFNKLEKGVVTNKEFGDIVDKLNSYLKKYKDTSDDRALAIIGALIIENELDRFLAEWIKKYVHLKGNADFTFSFKVNLATSLKLIPQKILNAIEPIRKIRNVFAHNLDISTFEEANKFDSESFSKLNNKIKMFIMDWNKNNDRETFMKLALMIASALIIYTKHIIKVQDYVWNPENLNKIILY
jgi:hypothetical protein